MDVILLLLRRLLLPYAEVRSSSTHLERAFI
jgi:hypothetical protein